MLGKILRIDPLAPAFTPASAEPCLCQRQVSHSGDQSVRRRGWALMKSTRSAFGILIASASIRSPISSRRRCRPGRDRRSRYRRAREKLRLEPQGRQLPLQQRRGLARSQTRTRLHQSRSRVRPRRWHLGHRRLHLSRRRRAGAGRQVCLRRFPAARHSSGRLFYGDLNARTIQEFRTRGESAQLRRCRSKASAPTMRVRFMCSEIPAAPPAASAEDRANPCGARAGESLDTSRA